MDDSIRNISISPNQNFIAFHHGKTLLVTLNDFTSIIARVDCPDAQAIQSMLWCGNDAIAFITDFFVTLISPSGDTALFPIESPVHAATECDGIVVLSNYERNFIQKVPAENDQVFRIGSTSPAALLFDAYNLFEKRNAKADETVRLIKKDLITAIQVCLEAALREFDVSLQKRLLKVLIL